MFLLTDIRQMLRNLTDKDEKRGLATTMISLLALKQVSSQEELEISLEENNFERNMVSSSLL